MNYTRILLLVLFIYFSYCDENPCTKQWDILLLVNEDTDHLELNEYLEHELRELSKYSFKNIHTSNIRIEKLFTSVLTDYSNNGKVDLKLMFQTLRGERPDLAAELFFNNDAWRADYKQTVVVYLHAIDIDRYNYNYILENNYIIADNGVKPTTKCNIKRIIQFQELCKSNVTQTDCDNMELIQKNCDLIEKRYSLRHTLVSKNILNFPSLYDYLAQFPSSNNNITLCQPEINVVICGLDNYEDSYLYKHEQLLLEMKHVPDCETMRTNDKTIAVLAPSPYDIPEDTHITTIFLEQFAKTDAEDMFINSFFAVPPQKAPLAISKFLKMNNCKRIAIISDDSATSKEYERQYTKFFEKENIIYASKTCDVSNCDFVEILRHLRQSKLILMNIAEEYAKEFTKQIRYVNIRRKIWLFPSWSATATRKVANLYIGEVFTIEMSTLLTHEGLLTNCENISNIVTEDLVQRPKSAHRKIAESLQKCLQSRKIVASVIQFDSQRITDAVARMIILPFDGMDEIDNIHYKQLQEVSIDTDLKNCMVTSTNYMKGCEDEDVMYIWLVVAVFVLMAVVIFYFFQSTKISYSRMND